VERGWRALASGHVLKEVLEQRVKARDAKQRWRSIGPHLNGPSMQNDLQRARTQGIHRKHSSRFLG